MPLKTTSTSGLRLEPPRNAIRVNPARTKGAPGISCNENRAIRRRHRRRPRPWRWRRTSTASVNPSECRRKTASVSDDIGGPIAELGLPFQPRAEFAAARVEAIHETEDVVENTGIRQHGIERIGKPLEPGLDARRSGKSRDRRLQRGCHRGQRIERRLDLGRDVGKRSGAVQGKQVGEPGLKFRQLGGNLRFQIVVLRRRRPVGDCRGVGQDAFKLRQIIEQAGDAIQGFGNEARCLAEIEADGWSTSTRLNNPNSFGRAPSETRPDRTCWRPPSRYRRQDR